VLCVEDITIHEDMLFCKPIKRRETAKELFKMVDDFMKEKARNHQTELEYRRMQLT
jgi:hypothetical protein